MNHTHSEYRKNENKPLKISIIAISLFLFIFITCVKIDTIYSWGYRSDIFSIDQVLSETLNGYFGMEYTYGNTFGDHAYLFLLLLLPLKILLGKNMIIFLLLLPPVFYMTTSMALFHEVKSKRSSFVGCLCSLFFLFMCFFGLHEKTYGFHLDTLSGFFAILFVYFLSIHYKNREERKNNAAPFIAFLIFYTFFILLKEEIALLGAVFFLVIFIFKRKIFLLAMGIISALVFIFDLLFINYLSTIFNRGSAKFMTNFWNGLKTDGINFFFNVPTETEYFFGYLIVISYILVFIFGIILSKRINCYALSLFLIGIGKIFICFYVVGDFSLQTWHNFPSLVMMTGALIIQVTEIKESKPLIYMLITACVFSFIFFIYAEFKYFSIPTIRNNQDIQKTLVEKRKYLADMKKLIDPDKVTAISGYSSIEWIDDFRFSFYPSGVSKSPRGIADYIVIEPENIINIYKNTVKALSLNPKINEDISEDDIMNILPEFELVARNKYYVMLKRISINKENKNQRDEFIKIFGEGSIGRKKYNNH